MEGDDEERNEGDIEDNRRGLDGGERGMITGRGARRRLQGRLPHPGRRKIKGGLVGQVRLGEHGEGRRGASLSEKDVSFLFVCV